MNMLSPIHFDIQEHASSYVYDEELFKPVYERLKQKLLAYDPEFGPYLVGHLERTGHDTEHFMLAEGYHPDIAEKVGHAVTLHDIGKILQPIKIWNIAKEDRTSEVNIERPKHGALGKLVLNSTIAELESEGLISVQGDVNAQAHIKLIKYVQDAHHERRNGTGPLGFPAARLCPIIELIAAVDTADGKRKNPAKTLSDIFTEMTGQKHLGEFDVPLIQRLQDYFETKPGETGQPILANQTLSR